MYISMCGWAGGKGEKEKENGKIQTIIVAWMVRL